MSNDDAFSSKRMSLNTLNISMQHGSETMEKK